MANYIGNCGYCGESVDRDDPDIIVVMGEVDRGRIHQALCSLDHLSRWSAGESLKVERRRHIRENVDKHPLSGMVCDACR